MKEMRNGGGEALQLDYRDGKVSAVGRGAGTSLLEEKSHARDLRLDGTCSRLGGQCG